MVQLVGAALLGRHRPPRRPVRRYVPEVGCARGAPSPDRLDSCMRSAAVAGQAVSTAANRACSGGVDAGGPGGRPGGALRSSPMRSRCSNFSMNCASRPVCSTSTYSCSRLRTCTRGHPAQDGVRECMTACRCVNRLARRPSRPAVTGSCSAPGAAAPAGAPRSAAPARRRPAAGGGGGRRRAFPAPRCWASRAGAAAAHSAGSLPRRQTRNPARSCWRLSQTYHISCWRTSTILPRR